MIPVKRTMKRLLLSGLLSLALTPFASSVAAPAPVFINNGSIDLSLAPPIDAITFINNGSITASTVSFAYRTSDTLNYTNTGSITASPGWWFVDSPASVGVPKPSANFFNDNNGTVDCSSVLLIEATNIVNQGQFTVGTLGLIELDGKNVDLAQSVFEVTGFTGPNDPGSASSYGVNTNQFIPANGVYDLYWAATNFDNNNPLNSRSIWDGNVASAPNVPFTPGTSSGAISGFSLDPSILVSDSYSNAISFGTVVLTNQSLLPYATLRLVTNLNKGAVFVNAASFLAVQTRFTGPGVSNFDDIHVLLSTPVTDAVTKTVSTNYIFFQDNLGNATSRGLLVNESTLNTFRPTNYYVDRQPHNDIFIFQTNIFNFVSNGVVVTVTNVIRPIGFVGLGKPETNFFLDSGNIFRYPASIVSDIVSNAIVTGGSYSAYSAFFDNLALRPPLVGGSSISNLPGSIQISAMTLNLDHARLRAEGLIAIRAANLISSTNAVIDCENLTYEIGSGSGELAVRNLVQPSVARLRGSIRAWSANWTNTVEVVITNNYEPVVVGNVTNVVQTPLTNDISMGYHVLILDATGLVNTLPVSVYDLIMHSSHISIEDDVTLLQSLLIDGRSFTINGSLTIPGTFPAGNPITGVRFPGLPLQDWVATNAPGLLFFTNNGTLSIFNNAHFGDDRPFPYLAFVNSGFIRANSLKVNSLYFDNPGILYSQQGATFIQCLDAILPNSGIIFSTSLLQLTANNLTMNGYRLSAADALTLYVTNTLSDGGPGSANLIQAQNGVNLPIKPRTGDFMGSTVQSIAPTTTDKTIHHLWAAEDRGPTTAGYTNNAAIGQLVLSASNTVSSFQFTGTAGPGVTNGLYVDLLDLTSLGQRFLTGLKIDPNLVLYYAAVRVPTNIVFPEPDSLKLPEEFLDGKLNGHLRWVRTFAGPNSSTTVFVDGQPIQVNSALRNSQLIDSNSNGIPNASESPFSVFSSGSFAPLNVQVIGNGTVIPDFNGTLFMANNLYTLIAQPSGGAKFTGWTGDIQSSSPVLSFVLPAGGLSLVANFSFPAASYSGLFFSSNAVEFLNSGAITITTTKNGNYTGFLQAGGNRYSFSGQFDSSGAGDASAGPYNLHLQEGNDQVTGTVSSENGSADLVANRAVFNARTNKAPFAGKYTIIFPGSGDIADTTDPQGDGFGAVTVNKSGKVHLSGRLADGSRIAQTATVSSGGQWPLYVRLYNGNGQILSWQTFTISAEVGGVFNWIKEPIPGDAFYPDGFTVQTNAIGSKYDPSLKPVTGFTHANVLLDGGNLASFIGNQVKISPNNKVTNLGGNKFTMTLTPSQGLFKGNVVDPITGGRVFFKGAILQNQTVGSGFFLGSSLSGHVTVGQ